MQIANIKLQIEKRSAILLGVLGVLAVSCFFGCGGTGGIAPVGDEFSGPTGSAIIRVIWPANGPDGASPASGGSPPFGPSVLARTIPAGTQSIEVKVLKASVELRALRTIVARPPGQTETTTRIENIPVGSTIFEARSRQNADGTGLQLAFGSATVNIAGRPDNAVTIDMTPTPVARIAFESDRDGNAEIYVMNVDGTGQVNLTRHPSWDEYPAWSPDGTRIAFITERDGNREIYVMNADGTGQTNLTNNSTREEYPAWSPDGTRIAFRSDRLGNAAIFVMSADGSGQTGLTSATTWNEDPAWSPDGTKIAFVSSRDGNREIYVMNADGTAQTRLTNNTSSDEREPAWSPDGAKITFVSNRDGNDEIYVMKADGTGQTNLTNNPTGDEHPTWSSDGTKIAFRSYRDGNWEVYAMNADGSGPTNLTNNPAWDGYPDWSLVP